MPREVPRVENDMPHQRVICETQSHQEQIGASLEEPVLDELASERGSVIEEAQGQDDRVPCTEEHQPYNEQEQSQACDSDIEVQETQTTLRRSTRDRRPGQMFTYTSLGQPTYQPRVTIYLFCCGPNLGTRNI
ncbi:unnamed protein product [Pleuronectes platessa]|uniref:Uncharacterized protein n=1 Tax=Pleuronectes platessa TaxID=8262 RepID=A0A9N7YHW7_PLEPL|nr:unnamed protein product [Pleuronectes platessa]